MAEEDPEIVAYRKKMAEARGEKAGAGDEIAAYKERMAKARGEGAQAESGPPPGYTRLLPPENAPAEPVEFTRFKSDVRDLTAKDEERSKYVSGRLGPMDRGIYEFSHGFGSHPSQDPSILERAGRVAGGLTDTAAGMKAAALATLGFPPAAPVTGPLAFGTASGASQYAREKGVAGILGEEDIGSPAERALQSGIFSGLTMGTLNQAGPIAQKLLPKSVVSAGKRVMSSTPGRFATMGGIGAGQAAIEGGNAGDIIERGLGSGIAGAGPMNLLRGAGGAAKAAGRFALKPEVVGTVAGGLLGGPTGALTGLGVGSGALEKIPMFSRIGTLTKAYMKGYNRLFPAEAPPRATSVEPGEFGGVPTPPPEGPTRGVPQPSPEEVQAIIARSRGIPENPEAPFAGQRPGVNRPGLVPENPAIGQAAPPTAEEAVAALRMRLALRKPQNPTAAFQGPPEPGPPPAGMVRDVGERVVKEPIRFRPEEKLQPFPEAPPPDFEINGPAIEPSPRGGPPPRRTRFGPPVEEAPLGKAPETEKLIEKLVEPPKSTDNAAWEAGLKEKLKAATAAGDWDTAEKIHAEFEKGRLERGMGTAGGQVSAGGAPAGAAEALDRLQAENPEQHFEVKIKKADGDVRTVTGSFRPRGLKNRMEILKANPAMASEDLEKLYRSQAGAPQREGVGPAVEGGRKFWDAENQKWITLKHENVLEIRSQELPNAASKTLWKKD